MDTSAVPDQGLPPPETSRAAFAALDHAHQQLVGAEVAELVATVHAADLYQVDQEAVFDGMERLVRPGHDGTPLVGEFLALEIGALLGISPDAAIGRIGQALDLRYRLPRLWEAVLAGRVRVWQALQACHATAGLSVEAAAEVDRQLAPALAAWPWGRVLRALPGWIAGADPQAAQARAEAAGNERRVHISRINDGHLTMWGLLDAADGIDFDHALNQIAGTLPNDPAAVGGSNLDARRAAAVGILARQASGQDTLPTHTLVVHITATDPAINPADPSAADRRQGGSQPQPTSGVAWVERWGALLTTQLPSFLANSKVVVRPIIDPATISPVDSHDPPAVMRFVVEQRNPVDVFPYATRPSSNCDTDHTIPYQPGDPGQTQLGNLGPLSRYAHRAKTHGGWQLEQPSPGVFRWTSPAGYRYLVTAGGTTRVQTPPDTETEPSDETGPPDEPQPLDEAG